LFGAQDDKSKKAGPFDFAQGKLFDCAWRFASESPYSAQDDRPKILLLWL